MNGCGKICILVCTPPVVDGHNVLKFEKIGEMVLVDGLILTYTSGVVESITLQVDRSIGTLKNSMLGRKGRKKNPIRRRQENSRPQKRLSVSSFLTTGSHQVVTSSSHAPSLAYPQGCTNSRTGKRKHTTKNHVYC